MKRAFTLVEMLGIITILAVVLLVTFPSISNSIRQAKVNSDNSSMNNLKMSVEAYVQLYRDKYPELNRVSGSTSIKVSELYDANLLKGNYVGVELDDVITVEVQSDSTLSYYFKGKEI